MFRNTSKRISMNTRAFSSIFNRRKFNAECSKSFIGFTIRVVMLTMLVDFIISQRIFGAAVFVIAVILLVILDITGKDNVVPGYDRRNEVDSGSVLGVGLDVWLFDLIAAGILGVYLNWLTGFKVIAVIVLAVIMMAAITLSLMLWVNGSSTKKRKKTAKEIFDDIDIAESTYYSKNESAKREEKRRYDMPKDDVKDDIKEAVKDLRSRVEEQKANSNRGKTTVENTRAIQVADIIDAAYKYDQADEIYKQLIEEVTLKEKKSGYDKGVIPGVVIEYISITKRKNQLMAVFKTGATLGIKKELEDVRTDLLVLSAKLKRYGDELDSSYEHDRSSFRDALLEYEAKDREYCELIDELRDLSSSDSSFARKQNELNKFYSTISIRKADIIEEYKRGRKTDAADRLRACLDSLKSVTDQLEIKVKVARQQENRKKHFSDYVNQHNTTTKREGAVFKALKYFGKCSNEDEIKAEYKRLCKLLHPDNGGDAKEFAAMQKEYKKLLGL